MSCSSWFDNLRSPASVEFMERLSLEGTIGSRGHSRQSPADEIRHFHLGPCENEVTDRTQFFLQSKFLSIPKIPTTSLQHEELFPPNGLSTVLVAICEAAKKGKGERPKARTSAMKGYHVVSLKLTPNLKEQCECKGTNPPVS